MYFPSEHAYPGELPVWRLAGHAFDAVAIEAEAEFERGEDRARQIYTWVPQIVSVSTLLSQAGFNRFVTWYEDDLQAGTRRFDNRVAAQGGFALAWWTTQFMAPYRYQVRPPSLQEASLRSRYEVSAQLFLLDGPYATRTAPSLRGRSPVVTTLEARSVNDGVLRGRAPVVTTLTGYLGEVPLRITEDDDDRITEDGEARSLES